MEAYLILQLVNNPICGAQQTLEGNLPISEAQFCSTERRNSRASHGPPGMWLGAPQHEISTAQAKRPPCSEGWSKQRWQQHWEQGAGSPLAAKPRWTVEMLNIAGSDMCVFITNTTWYTHAYAAVHNPKGY